MAIEWEPGHGWAPLTQEDTDPGAEWQPLISLACAVLGGVLAVLVLAIVAGGVAR